MLMGCHDVGWEEYGRRVHMGVYVRPLPGLLWWPTLVHYYNHYNKSFSLLTAVSHARVSHGQSVSEPVQSVAQPNDATRCQSQVTRASDIELRL